MRRIVFILLCLCAAPAWAVDHWQACDKDHEAGTAFTGSQLVLKSAGLGGGKKSICYDTDGTADSLLVTIAACDQIDLQLYNLTDGDISTASVIPRMCGTDTASTTLCEPMTSDLATETNPGGGLQGIGADYVFIDVVTNTGSDDLRVMLRCNVF